MDVSICLTFPRAQYTVNVDFASHSFVSLFSFQGTPAVGSPALFSVRFRTLYSRFFPLLFLAACWLLDLVPRVLTYSSVLCGARLASGAAGGLKWTRTIDLTLIRRAL